MSSNSPEAKSSKLLREVMSFVLFGFLVFLSLSLCLKSFVFDTDNITECLTDYGYVQGVRENTIQYAKDIYQRNGLDSENIEDAFIFDYFQDAVNAYFGYQICGMAIYSENSYVECVNTISIDFRDALESQIKKQKLNIDSDKVEAIADSVTKYIASAIEVNHISEVKSGINIGSIASSVAVGICAFFTLATGSVLYFLGNKRHRSTRAIAISFLSASLFDFIFAVMTVIIFKIKTIDIYPLYLRRQLYMFIDSTVEAIGIAGSVLAIVAIVLLAFTWRLRKEID